MYQFSIAGNKTTQIQQFITTPICQCTMLHVGQKSRQGTGFSVQGLKLRCHSGQQLSSGAQGTLSLSNQWQKILLLKDFCDQVTLTQIISLFQGQLGHITQPSHDSKVHHIHGPEDCVSYTHQGGDKSQNSAYHSKSPSFFWPHFPNAK